LAVDFGEPVACGDQADSLDRKRIGRFAAKLLAEAGGRGQVLYLSTGRTVREVAASLLNDHIDKLSVVLTDNFAIACLWRQYASRDGSSRLPQLYILGGILDFSRDDVMQPRGKGNLDHWKCSTAVVSATGVNPRTGEIYSFRQEETKREFFKDASVQRVIIPVTADKFEVLGGRMIYDPNDRPVNTGTRDDDRKYEIVTTKIEAGVKTSLSKFYQVHVVPDDYE
jgi:DeoR/GlpR family transcriptional regulator of sugar metabolism